MAWWTIKRCYNNGSKSHAKAADVTVLTRAGLHINDDAGYNHLRVHINVDADDNKWRRYVYHDTDEAEDVSTISLVLPSTAIARRTTV